MKVQETDFVVLEGACDSTYDSDSLTNILTCLVPTY